MNGFRMLVRQVDIVATVGVQVMIRMRIGSVGMRARKSVTRPCAAAWTCEKRRSEYTSVWPLVSNSSLMSSAGNMYFWLAASIVPRRSRTVLSYSGLFSRRSTTRPGSSVVVETAASQRLVTLLPMITAPPGEPPAPVGVTGVVAPTPVAPAWAAPGVFGEELPTCVVELPGMPVVGPPPVGGALVTPVHPDAASKITTARSLQRPLRPISFGIGVPPGDFCCNWRLFEFLISVVLPIADAQPSGNGVMKLPPEIPAHANCARAQVVI